MYNSMMVFTFSLLDRKHLFWVNLVQKIKIVSLSWNLVPRPIWICRILWSCLLFLLHWKHPFCSNLVRKIKIFSLSWNLVPSLIWICRVQWWCSFFCFRLETPSSGKFGPTNQNCQFKLKFGIYILIRICRFQWWCSLFLFYIGNTFFYCLCDRTGVETLK